MNFLNPGFLKSRDAFRLQFYNPIHLNRDAQKKEQLQQVIKPFLLRRLKTDKSVIDDLPDKIENKVFCELTPEQASLYQAALDESLERVEKADAFERLGLVFKLLTSLKQICNHPAHYLKVSPAKAEDSGKFARLDELCSEILSREEAALIFTQYTAMASLLVHHLETRYHRSVLYLHGGTSRKERVRLVERFQGGEAPFFVLSLKAGGVGLNLTKASHVIHFDRWWNPAVETQATDRAFRIGQKKNVHVHPFVCLGTFEEQLDRVISQKRELAEELIADGERWLSELPHADLKEILRLRS
jgi:SNF2 family DNA or RNA helicase